MKVKKSLKIGDDVEFMNYEIYRRRDCLKCGRQRRTKMLGRIIAINFSERQFEFENGIIEQGYEVQRYHTITNDSDIDRYWRQTFVFGERAHRMKKVN
jgi:hypothetical protein